MPPSTSADDFRPGDVVSWNLRNDGGYVGHIGVVSAVKGRNGRFLVVHNIGAGARLEDVLFQWKMTGRFRPAPRLAPAPPP